MSTVKRLALAVVQFLAEQREFGGLSSDAQESLEVAVQCLETAFALDPKDSESLSLSRSLLDIFQEALEKDQASESLPPEASPESKAQAEALKNEGNNLMKAEKYADAIDYYGKAIALDGRNAVYYCNRAAAHSKMNNHDLALADCKTAITIDPKYSKAYGRMGLAYSSLDQDREAFNCYQRALELEPDNESYRSNLKIAEDKLKQARPSMPGGVPSMPDLGGLLSNPGLMNMATQMLSNPSMQNLMGQLMSGATGGSEAGGLDALLRVGQQLAQQMQESNPELVEQLRQQMGGPGGPPEGEEPPTQ